MEKIKKRPPRVPTSSRFEFHTPIGAGGAGTVYRGLDRRTGEAVAIKVLGFKLSENPTLHERLAREFRAATLLEHPNIVRAIAMETDGETSFVVYELVDGGSLGDRIKQHGRLAEPDAVRIITQVAQALHYAHENMVVHRDVKPDNILLLADGRAKLTDFGLAKDYGHSSDQDLTRHASGLGTPHFMAPEQFADARSVGLLCDVYSPGATLYNMLTGELPFDAKFPLAILTKKEKSPIPSARAKVPALSERTDTAIRAALDPEPSRRPGSCLEFFKLLTTRRSGRKPPPPPAEIKNTRRTSTRIKLKCGSCGVIDASVQATGQAEEMWPLVIQDVSSGGVGLLLARRFEPGTRLAIELAGADGKPRRIATTVVRVQRERAGHWVHGCQFVAPLAEADANLLMAFA